MINDMRRWIAFVSSMVLIACWDSALAQTYTAAELGLLPGGTYTYVEAINNAGQAVGTADNDRSSPGVIWVGAMPTTLVNGDNAFFGSILYAINNLGVVVGNQRQESAFVWSPTHYNTLGYDEFFFADSINDSGKIVGGQAIFNGPTSVALSWASPYATTWTVLPLLQPANFGGSFATGINNRGQIVGAFVLIDDLPFVNGAQHATLWSGVQVTDLGTLGGTNSDAAAINDSGQIVGWADIESGAQHAASWIGTKVADLGTLGGTNSYANAVNISGEIVGAAETSSGTQHAALFIGGKVVDLNAALSHSLAAYITLTDAVGINDSHLIVANGVDSRTGSNHAFLLTPSMKVLNCVQGGNFYKVVRPSNFVSSNVSPNISGHPSICALPSSEPPTWYIKTTIDGGVTWHWKYMLEDLGLGELPFEPRGGELRAR